MTIAEMHYDFDLKLDKVATLSKPNFNLAEKDWLLNEAQEVFVKQRMGTNNPKRRGFESIQKRIDDLSMLHVKYPRQPGITPVSHPEGVFELELDKLAYPYMHLTRAWVDAEYEDCLKKVKLKAIQNDDLEEALDDPFSASSIGEHILYNFGRSDDDESPSIYIYPGTPPARINKVYVEYIKRPVKMNYGGYVYLDGNTYTTQNCELSEHTHPEIVDVAVQIAAGIIEHPQYVQLKTQKVFSHE